MDKKEKLKRIKLISEKLFVEIVLEVTKHEKINRETIELLFRSSVDTAEFFVTEFEKFEDEFMKDEKNE